MNSRTDLVRTGRAWVFGDNINTDLIFPSSVFHLPLDEQYKSVFVANRPGWIDMVEEGDLLIAGSDFGMGSGRPIGSVLRRCGIAGVVAESINGIALRSCVNSGLPAIPCAGVGSFFAEGDIARINFNSGLVENLTRSAQLTGTGLPPLLTEIISCGGIVRMLVAKGLIEPAPTLARST